MSHFLAILFVAAQPIPDPVAVTAAEQTVAEVFGAQIKAARDEAGQADLAKRLLDTADGSEPAEQYVLFRRARDLAISADSPALGVRATEGLAAFAGPSDAAAAHRAWSRAKDLEAKLQVAEVYLRALPNLDGFARRVVEQRLDELRHGAPLTPDEIGRLKPQDFATIELGAPQQWLPLVARAPVLSHEPPTRMHWAEIPKHLQGMAFAQANPQATREFQIKRSGLVILAVTTRWGDSGSGGSWQKELTTKEQLSRHGWKPIGTLKPEGTWALPWEVFARRCTAGERWRLRTEKYMTPILILRPPGRRS